MPFISVRLFKNLDLLFTNCSPVSSIERLIEKTHISEMFLGLILVPLVEKVAEHLTAVDEAWDNTPNLFLSHILGSTLQTALLNAPLVVLVSWGTGRALDFNFSPLLVILLILSILVVGQFLRDGESNYLEGILCVLVYILVAVAAFYYPNKQIKEDSSGSSAKSHILLLARAAVNGVAGKEIF